MKKLALSSLDVAAIIYATMLSIACLARGAVYDVVLGLLLLASMPILFIALSGARMVHTKLKAMGIFLFVCLALIMLMQQWIPSSGSSLIWHQMESVTGLNIHITALHDKAAWFQGIGRFLFLVFAFFIALAIGSSESSARWFLHALLASGAVCLAITFFMVTEDGVPSSSYYSYRHGFVNPNNAATYLGVMLLLVLAQISRYLKRPSKAFYKLLPELLDNLNITSIIKGFFLLFSTLLFLGGLLMTGSRGGVLFSLLCCFIFALIIAFKISLQSQTRRWIIAFISVLMVCLCLWSVLNFGNLFLNKLECDGASHNSRLDIFAAVIPMIKDHPWLGVGLGSFPAAFQQYRPQNISADGIIDKAHNTYLEFAAEMGLPAFFILMVVILWVGFLLYYGAKKRRERYVTPVLGLSIWLLGALHSLVDFPLQIPSLAALFITIIVICASQTDPRFSEPAQSTSSTKTKRIRIRKRRDSKKA